MSDLADRAPDPSGPELPLEVDREGKSALLPGRNAAESVPPVSMSRGQVRRRLVTGTVLALALLAGPAGWFWWRGAGTGAGQPAQAQGGAKVPVEVAEAQAADLPIFLDSLGTVQAFNTVTVRSRVDGEVMTIAFQEGQMVQAGDVLARIDPRPYQAALDQAVAKKAQDEATLASSQGDLTRTRQLASREFATQQQLDQQNANVGALGAQIKADQAAIDLARTQLDYATVRAPISGRTGLRLVDQGNIVRTSDTTGIVEIAQLQPISVIFTAPESQLPAIADAMRSGAVEVQALASDAKAVLAKGKLALINNQVDRATGTVRLKATFDNAEERLWPGLSVNTRLLAKTLKGVTAMPEDGLQRGQNELFAFVVGPDGKVEKRTLKVGPFSQGKIAIEEGLRPGDRVVTAGHSRLQPGSAVEIARPPGQGGPDRPRESPAGGRTASSGQ